MANTITEKQKDDLFEAACKVRKLAHILPGNTYRGGSALLTKSGKIYTGCNIENAAHTATICAERLAIFKAYSEEDRDIVAIMYVSEECGTACGVCRQVIAELAPNAALIFTDLQRKKEIVSTINEMLPYSWSNPTLSESK